MAVDWFIVLSGFCLMLQVVKANGELRGGALEFFRRRARRILPPYYAAVFVSLVLIKFLISQPTGTPWDDCIAITRWGLISHLLLLHDFYTPHWFVYSQIDHPLWSVALEWHIYLLFPAMVWMWKRVGGIAATGITFIGVAIAVLGIHFTPVRILCLNYVALFAMGVAACAAAFSDIAPWPAIRKRAPLRIVALLSLVATIFLMNRFTDRDLGSQLTDPAMGLCAAAVLVWVSISHTSPLRSLLQWRPLVALGTMSYSLYLIHAPLIQLIWQYALRPMHLNSLQQFFALVSIGMVGVIGGSWLFFQAFERPFLSSKRTASSNAESARPVPVSAYSPSSSGNNQPQMGHR
jgi:peptidoglycan/LPS O-acetylase OafA/YrhL